MRKRSKSREYAVQILYQMDITGDATQVACINFWESQESEVEEEVKLFTQELVDGVHAHLAEIDAQVRPVRQQLAALAHGGSGPQHFAPGVFRALPNRSDYPSQGIHQ